MQSSEQFDFAALALKRLNPGSPLKPFDCGDADLNEFFHKDSSEYARQLLGVTYTFESDAETLSFFTVLNDKIVNEDGIGGRISNKILRRIPNRKRRPTFPAVKVGRLGVSLKYFQKGIGSQTLDFIKHFFTDSNKTGCRFITVDAYNNEKVIGFYKKNGFVFLTNKDKEDDTRLMWFDMKTFKPEKA